MSHQHVLTETRGQVGLITLNDPEKLNAMGDDMRVGLRDAVETFKVDKQVRAVVITGAGRAFSAGADMKAFREAVRKQAAGEPRIPARILTDAANERIRSSASYLKAYPKPIIAALNGPCVGVAATMSLSFDFRLAAESAFYCFAFARIGLVPELAASALLPQMVGLARATDWCLTSRNVSAQECHQAGLVSEVLPDDKLLDRALELGALLANRPIGALVATRKILSLNVGASDFDNVARMEAAFLDPLYETAEHKEAIAAFLEKRPPDFSKAG